MVWNKGITRPMSIQTLLVFTPRTQLQTSELYPNKPQVPAQGTLDGIVYNKTAPGCRNLLNGHCLSQQTMKKWGVLVLLALLTVCGLPNKLVLKVLSFSKSFGDVFVHTPKESEQNNPHVVLDTQLSTALDLSSTPGQSMDQCLLWEGFSSPPFPSALELGLAAMLFLPSLLTSSATTESLLY